MENKIIKKIRKMHPGGVVTGNRAMFFASLFAFIVFIALFTIRCADIARDNPFDPEGDVPYKGIDESKAFTASFTGTNSVALSWTHPGGDAFSHFEVNVQEPNKTAWSAIYSGTAKSVEHTGVTPNSGWWKYNLITYDKGSNTTEITISNKALRHVVVYPEKNTYINQQSPSSSYYTVNLQISYSHSSAFRRRTLLGFDKTALSGLIGSKSIYQGDLMLTSATTFTANAGTASFMILETKSNWVKEFTSWNYCNTSSSWWHSPLTTTNAGIGGAPPYTRLTASDYITLNLTNFGAGNKIKIALNTAVLAAWINATASMTLVNHTEYTSGTKTEDKYAALYSLDTAGIWWEKRPHLVLFINDN